MNRAVQFVRSVSAWFSTLRYIIKNRGNSTYGATQLRTLVEKYIFDYGQSSDDYSAAQKAVEEIIPLLTPKANVILTRIGPASDGGYIGVAPSTPPILLSGGAGKNTDFEYELAKDGAIIHIYDPRVQKIPRGHPNITHFKEALSSENDKTFEKSKSLMGAISLLDYSTESPLWLKLDIEGSEMQLLADEISTLEHFSQIFIEFHDSYRLVDEIFRKNFLAILKALAKNFDLVSISSNNWRGVTNFGHVFIPDTFEVTYLNKKVITKSHPKDVVDSLKRPNNPRRLAIPAAPFAVSPAQ
jgi:hypothetical protein